MKIKFLTFVFVFIATFITAQTHTILHDVEHPFHKHTSKCDIYTFSNLSENVHIDAPSFNEVVIVHFENIVTHQALHVELVKLAYNSRAPPKTS